MYGNHQGAMTPSSQNQQSQLSPAASSFKPNPNANDFTPQRRGPRPNLSIILPDRVHHGGPVAHQAQQSGASTNASDSFTSASSAAHPTTDTAATSLHSGLQFGSFPPVQITFSAAMPPKPDWQTAMVQQQQVQHQQSMPDLSAHHNAIQGLGVNVQGQNYHGHSGFATLRLEQDPFVTTQQTSGNTNAANRATNSNANTFPVLQRPFGHGRRVADQPRVVPKHELEEHRQFLIRKQREDAEGGEHEEVPPSPTVSDPFSDHYLIQHPELTGAQPEVWREMHDRNAMNTKIINGYGNVHEAYEGGLHLSRNLNPDHYQMPYGAKVVSIRTEFVRDVTCAVRLSHWSDKPSVSRRVMKVWEECQKHSEKVIFLFSVNNSRHFCALAEMTGPWVEGGALDGWNTEACAGSIPLRWLYVKNVPYTLFSHLKHENGQPIANMWCGQVFSHDMGREIIRIYVQAPLIFNILSWPDGCEQLPMPTRGGAKQGFRQNTQSAAYHNNGGPGAALSYRPRQAGPRNRFAASNPRTADPRLQGNWRRPQIGFGGSGEQQTPAQHDRRGVIDRSNGMQTPSIESLHEEAASTGRPITVTINPDGSFEPATPSPNAEASASDHATHQSYASAAHHGMSRMVSHGSFRRTEGMPSGGQFPRSINKLHPGSLGNSRSHGNLHEGLHAVRSWDDGRDMRQAFEHKQAVPSPERRDGQMVPYSAPAYQNEFASGGSMDTSISPRPRASRKAEYFRLQARLAELNDIDAQESGLTSVVAPSTPHTRPDSVHFNRGLATSSVENYNVSPVRDHIGRGMRSISRNRPTQNTGQHRLGHRQRFDPDFSQSFDMRIQQDVNKLVSSPQQRPASPSSMGVDFHQSPTPSTRAPSSNGLPDSTFSYGDGGNFGYNNLSSSYGGDPEDGSGGCRLES